MILTGHPELLDLSGELVARCPHRQKVGYYHRDLPAQLASSTRR